MAKVIGTDTLKLAALRAQIDVGVRALDSGDFDEIEGRDLDRYLARLTPPRKQARKRAR